MQAFWRTHSNWNHIGGAHTSDQHPAAPRAPQRPKVRMRAIGKAGAPSFMLKGSPVPHGAVVDIDADDAPTLELTGKAVRVE